MYRTSQTQKLHLDLFGPYELTSDGLVSYVVTKGLERYIEESQTRFILFDRLFHPDMATWPAEASDASSQKSYLYLACDVISDFQIKSCNMGIRNIHARGYQMSFSDRESVQ